MNLKWQTTSDAGPMQESSLFPPCSQDRSQPATGKTRYGSGGEAPKLNKISSQTLRGMKS